jgi:putative membrane protein
MALASAAAGLVGICLLSRWGEMLFSAHMGQHLLLIIIIAPMLVLSGLRIRIEPIWGWLLFVGTFLFWHWPSAFQWAAERPLTQLLELASIGVTAICFWSAVFNDGRLSDGARALMVLTAAIVTDMPGVVMLFSPRTICVMPHENAALFGLTPLQDQQLAGLLMWVPANLMFFGIATFMFARWIGAVRQSA